MNLPGSIYYSIDLDHTYVWTSQGWVEVDNKLNTIIIRDFQSFGACKAWRQLFVAPVNNK